LCFFLFFLWTPCICDLHASWFLFIYLFLPLNAMHLWSSCFMLFIYFFLPLNTMHLRWWIRYMTPLTHFIWMHVLWQWQVW
jgi:hypothetical protein